MPADSGDRPTSAADLAARQNADQRARHGRAVVRQRDERLIAGGRVVPARITIALDVRGLDGPEVDIACGAEEPAVDLWECGVEVPDEEQLRLLATLTGFPIVWFYRPLPAGPLLGGDGRLWICGSGGCESPEPDWVDERGVLHYGGQPPRTPPASFQGSLFHAPAPSMQERPARTAGRASSGTGGESALQRPWPAKQGRHSRRSAPAGARGLAGQPGAASVPAGVQQPLLPAGRLSDQERAELMARIEAAKRKFR